MPADVNLNTLAEVRGSSILWASCVPCTATGVVRMQWISVVTEAPCPENPQSSCRSIKQKTWTKGRKKKLDSSQKRHVCGL